MDPNEETSPPPAPPSEADGASPEPALPTASRDTPAPPVVGIGASAGGLAALKAFFEHVPEDSGLAWVVVVHLAPEHESRLAELLQPHAKVPVQQVADTVKLEVDRAYVIPPGANLDAVDTHLRLSRLEERREERAPIDHFFRTLARTHDGHAVAVVLTGTGSDGALGVRDVKAQGGLTVAQDPSEAAFDGMPRAAIATGTVDLVLPVEEIPAAALRFASTRPRVPVPPEGESVPAAGHLLPKVFAQIRAHTGRDFSLYKRSTVLRRITRRMRLRQVEELAAYLDLLREEPDEVHALADDLLIPVTSFFRDPETFEALAQDVIPHLFEGKEERDEVRVWSVGCATGEEAYSLAMLLLEEAARRDVRPHLRVFASDLHKRSLAHAREGFYPGEIAADVDAERLRRFFETEDGGYRVRKEVRELVVFAPHDLLGDPPFSKLDLVACRNVLIYLQRTVQHDVAELFHYALRPGGWLMLGTSEGVDDTDLFRLVDKDASVYRRRSVPWTEPRLPVFPFSGLQFPGRPDRTQPSVEPEAHGGLFQQMLKAFGPPTLLVSPDDRVVYLSAQAGRYLVHPGGELTASVFKLVRGELRIELRATLHAARRRKAPMSSKPVRIGDRSVVLHAHPAQGAENEGYVLLLLDERPAAEADASTAAAREGAAPDARALELESELERERERLRAFIEEYETSREQMRASNEELQSANEELRSMMEELETSKEELQSVNEELQTVNQENRHKVEELAQLSGDLQNLLASTDIATLFLDHELRVLRFTPKASELFSVRPVDRGRPLSDLTHRLGYDELTGDAEAVLDRLMPVEREVMDESGQWYLARVLPYRSLEDRIAGVVLTFVDITERKRAEDEVREAKEYAESIVETLHEPLLVLTPDLRVQSANPSFYEHFEVRQEGTIGRLVYDLGNGQWDIPELRTLLEDVLPDSHVFNDYEVRHDFEDLGERVMLLNARRLDHVQLILLGIRDITEQKRSDEALGASEERFRALVNANSYVVYRMSPDWSEMRALDGQGFIADTIRPSTSWLEEYIDPEDQPEVLATIAEAVRTKSLFALEHRVRRVDGTLGWTLSRAIPLLDDDGEIVEWFGAAADITARKEAEQELRTSEERFRSLFSESRDVILVADDDAVYLDANPAATDLLGYTRDELVGMRISDISDVDEDAFQEAWATFRREGRMQGEFRLRTKAGQSLDVEFRAVANVLPGEHMSTLRDVTERKRLDEALRQSERRVRELARELTLAEQQERRRLAHVLHEDLQQRLVAARMVGSFRPNETAAPERVAELHRMLNEALDISRTLSHEMSPPILRGTELDDLLRWLAEQTRKQYDLDVEVVVQDEVRVPDEALRILLYQFLRELLLNVVKHAGTSRARLVGERRNGEVRVRVEDEGSGFDTASLDTSTGLGLANVRERLELVGGRLDVESTPGAGTRITLSFPTAPPPDEA